MKDIFKTICDRVKAGEQIFQELNLAPIRHFDLFKGQYLNPDQVQPYELPALFYQYSVLWDEAGSNTQKGACTVTIHLELDGMAESYEGSSDQDTALMAFDYFMLVNVLLQGLEGEDFTGLKRKTDDPDLSPSATTVHLITYETLYTDTSTHRLREHLQVYIDDLSVMNVKEPEPAETPSKYVL